MWSRIEKCRVNPLLGGLEATLLQWTADDFAFREIAYAILCLAAGGLYLTALPKERVIANREGYSNVKPEDQDCYNTAFVAPLVSGAHLAHQAPGSAPTESMYWMEGVLVFLTTQLFRPNIFDAEFLRVNRYCQEHHPSTIIDAVLMSIEHVVLVHVDPAVELQYSPLMQLFSLSHNTILDGRDRYLGVYSPNLTSDKEKRPRKGVSTPPHEPPSDESVEEGSKPSSMNSGKRYLSQQLALQKQKVSWAEAMSKANAEDRLLEISDQKSAFFTLLHLFDAAARRQMPPNRMCEGSLPNEIYGQVLPNVSDEATLSSCARVFREFRILCHENL